MAPTHKGAALPAFAAVAVLLFGLARTALGHAVMIKPESRAWYDYLLRYNYNPHAVYGGGQLAVSNGGKLKWPARNRYR